MAQSVSRGGAVAEPSSLLLLALASVVSTLLGALLFRASRMESMWAFAMGSLLGGEAMQGAGFPAAALFFCALSPAFLVAGGLLFAGRRLTLAFLPLALGYGALHGWLGLAGQAGLAKGLGLLVEPAALGATALLCLREEKKPAAAALITALGMASFAAAEGIGHVSALLIPTQPTGLPRLALGFLAAGLLIASSILRWRDLGERARRRVRETHDRFEAIASAAHDMILEVDEDRRIAWISPGVSRLLDYQPEELVGVALAEKLHPGDLAMVTARAGPFEDDSVGLLPPVRVRAKDGTWRLLEGSLRGRPGEAGGARFVIIARDVTDRLRFEESLRSARKHESLALLAGGVAHDFNNALMGVLGGVDELRQRVPGDSALRPIVGEIEASAERATRLTDQLVSYAGRGALRPETLDLTALTGEMSSLLSRTLPELISVEFKPGGDAHVQGDGGRVREALVALLTHARESVTPNGGRITVTTGVASLEAERLRAMVLGEDRPPGSYAFVEVTDDGDGMDADARDRLFDPFFVPRTQGSGLGPATVLGLARSHEGAIEVLSNHGYGTSIRLFLPEASGAALLVNERSPQRIAPEWRGSGVVLVVDDEEPILRLARRTLEPRGFEVWTEANGRDAVETFRRHRGEIRAVVMDVMMPEMRGDDALVSMRRYDPDVPVVLSSGWNIDECLKRVSRDEIAAFLPKPYRHGDLLACLRDVLETE